jgi:hypothetical protein
MVGGLVEQNVLAEEFRKWLGQKSKIADEFAVITSKAEKAT